MLTSIKMKFSRPVKSTFLKTIVCGLLISSAFAQTQRGVEGPVPNNQGYFWGLDSKVSTVSISGKINKQWFSLNKAVTKEFIKKNHFGSNYFITGEMLGRKKYVGYKLTKIDINGFYYQNYIDFITGNIYLLDPNGGKELIFNVPEIKGDNLDKFGGNFFVTGKGYVGAITSDGLFSLSTKEKYKDVSVVGGNYFINDDKLYLVSSFGEIFNWVKWKINPKNVILKGGSFFVYKEKLKNESEEKTYVVSVAFNNRKVSPNSNQSKIIERMLLKRVNLDTFLTQINKSLSTVDFPLTKESFLEPFITGGTFLTYKSGNAGKVITFNETADAQLKTLTCQSCAFDYNGDEKIDAKTEIRNWDFSRVSPKTYNSLSLVGHNYVIYNDGTIWTVNNKGDVNLSISLNKEINVKLPSAHNPIISNFPYR